MLDGAAVPVRKRRGFASMAIGRWSPFADPQFHVEWVGDRAMVWAWSRGRVLGTGQDDAVELQALAPRRVLPESLYRGQPLAEGEELLRVDSGVEGRIWRDHVLVASEWWPHVPGLADWNLFRRGAGLPSSAGMPALADAALGDVAWTAQRGEGWSEVATRHRSAVLAAVVGLATAVLAVPLVAAIALAVSIWQVEQEIASQGEDVQSVLAAREQAERDLAQVDSLLALRPPGAQIELMSAVLGLVPPDARILEWRMPDPDRIEIDISAARPDPQAMVEAWEGSGRFRDVTAELGRTPQEISIKATIVRRSGT